MSFGCHSNGDHNMIKWWLDNHNVCSCHLCSWKTARKRRSKIQNFKKIIQKESDSFGNSSMPSCHWSETEQLRDQELSYLLSQSRKKKTGSVRASRRNMLPGSQSASAFLAVSTVFFRWQFWSLATATSCLCQPQRFPVSHAFPCFPSHKRVPLTRSLCSVAVRSWW